MALLDQYGNPLRREDLKKEQATPDFIGVRQILSSQQTSNLTPYKLGRIMRDADEGDAVAYLEMAEELEEKDTHYLSVIGTRKRAVAQLEITVEPASDDKSDVENAELIQSWLNRDALESEIFDMLDAVGKGFSATEIIWDMSSDIWLPKELKWRDPRWFAFAEDGETLLLREGGIENVPLKPYKFIVHKHKAKSGLTIRGGVVRPCVWMWLFKNFSIKDWVIFAEAYGQPVRIGTYGASASDADKAVLLRAVSQIGSDAAAIIPESMKIDFVEAQGKTGTVDVFEKLCNFADQQISKAVLGQTTTTDAISGGGLAGNSAHREVREDIEKADAKQLAATLNEQLIIPIIVLNRGPQKNYPRLRIGRSEQIDEDKFSQVAERGAKLGLKISASKTREKMGLPAPVDDNDILVLPAQTPPADNGEKNEGTESATASERRALEKDAIDDIVDEMSARYEELLNPMVEHLEAAAAEAKDFDEFKQKLLQIAGSPAMAKFGEQLAMASFMARLAGNVEADIGGGDDA